jgi:Uma2 family endonuclease
MPATAPTVRRWSLEEYYRMGDLGFFTDGRVELIDGEIIDMAPQRDTHAAAVSLIFKAVSKIMPESLWVRCQLPLHLGEASEPEPDLSVVAGSERDFVGTGHPRTALLIAEISDTSLQFDRGNKASLYASAGIKDFWIVNLTDRCVEVYRTPVHDGSAKFGFRYADRSVYSAQDRVKPLVAAGEIAVADILP